MWRHSTLLVEGAESPTEEELEEIQLVNQLTSQVVQSLEMSREEIHKRFYLKVEPPYPKIDWVLDFTMSDNRKVNIEFGNEFIMNQKWSIDSSTNVSRPVFVTWEISSNEIPEVYITTNPRSSEVVAKYFKQLITLFGTFQFN